MNYTINHHYHGTIWKRGVEKCMQEYADQQLNEFKRKLKEEIDLIDEEDFESLFYVFSDTTTRIKSLIDKIEL